MRRDSTAVWYKYYAGYSAEFVRDVVGSLNLSTTSLLADPWNGAGTTTEIAEEMGVPSWGGDLNPAMIVVAKARLLRHAVSPSELPLCTHILSAAKNVVWSSDEEPLLVWLRPSAASRIRNIERAISIALDSRHADGPPCTVGRVADLSPLAAFYYLALFRTLRDVLAPFTSSNPTWIKTAKDERFKLDPSWNRIAELFLFHVTRMTDGAAIPVGDLQKAAFASENVRARLSVANSTKIPLSAQCVDAVVGSPPYCTRLDYAVATAPELAILGFLSSAVRKLREGLIGTSAIIPRAVEPQFEWGPTCARFLEAVSRHPSKASSSYYLPNFIQYFDGLAKSVAEIDRILRPGASCVLVVQDSHFKNVRNDLATIVSEMCDGFGWELRHRYNYRSKHLMARVNKRVREHRDQITATESALVFATPRS